MDRRSADNDAATGARHRNRFCQVLEGSLRNLSVAALVAGLLLHAYVMLFHTESSSAAPGRWLFYLYRCTPYFLCAYVGFSARNHMIGLCGAIAVLAADILVLSDFYFSPDPKDAGIGLAFVPIAELLMIAPAGMLLGLLVGKLATARSV